MINQVPLQKAQNALKKYWGEKIPVNPITVAENAGVEVYSSDELDVDGEFFYYGNSPTIVYRKSGNIRRDRFTIAHEFGHFYLRHGKKRYRDNNYSFIETVKDKFEVEANMFAAELLMPQQAIDYAINISKMDTLKELCDFFDVSYSAMRLRLGYLDLLDGISDD